MAYRFKNMFRRISREHGSSKSKKTMSDSLPSLKVALPKHSAPASIPEKSCFEEDSAAASSEDQLDDAGDSSPLVDKEEFSSAKAAMEEERAALQKTVSDLAQNNETKTQEIAALRMEINRLRETLKEREATRETEKTSLNDDAESTSKCAEAENTSSELQLMVQKLSSENQKLRDQFLQLGISYDSSPLSDQEKEMILSKISLLSQPVLSDAVPSCDRVDWDNKSSSSVSEMSVACLQDRIQQMEETHYCTHEELQATLQELDDLREQLSECQHELQQLQEEKQVILESLTQQTEKLNESRMQNDTLKYMLIQHAENSQNLSQCEKTQRLMDLLKSVQEDREVLQLKQEELERQVLSTKEVEERYQQQSQFFIDRIKLLESMVEDATNEKKSIESQVDEAQEHEKALKIENAQMKVALDTAKEKIMELEAAVISGEKSELADVLKNVRHEKEVLDEELAAMKKKYSALMCENERLKNQISALQDDLMVTRNNAKTHMDDVEWRQSILEEERRRLEQEVEQLKQSLQEHEDMCQHHLEDKRELKASLSEFQKKVSEVLDQKSEVERTLTRERSSFEKQIDEWNKFQADLLTAVRVANEFKMESQTCLERVEHENSVLRDKVKQIEMDLEKARACSKATNSVAGRLAGEKRLNRSVSANPVPNGELGLITCTRSARPLARGDSRVKSLIESIESATKQCRAGSRSSSTSSICSTGSETNNNIACSKPQSSTLNKRTDTECLLRAPSATSPLKESGNTLPCSTSTVPAGSLRSLQKSSFCDDLSLSKSSSNFSDTAKLSQLGEKVSGKSVTDGKPVSILLNKVDSSALRKSSYGQVLATEKKDPLASLAQTGGSKRNALLKWCQNKTLGYNHVDITNFSSSWNDGLALCALLDTYLPEKINYRCLGPSDRRRNFEVATNAAESVGIATTLDINDLMTTERPKWQTVYSYVTSIFGHFET